MGKYDKDENNRYANLPLYKERVVSIARAPSITDIYTESKTSSFQVYRTYYGEMELPYFIICDRGGYRYDLHEKVCDMYTYLEDMELVIYIFPPFNEPVPEYGDAVEGLRAFVQQIAPNVWRWLTNALATERWVYLDGVEEE